VTTADHPPPHSTGDERDVLMALLQYQRASFARKIEGVDERAAREPLVASGTTILWLAKHMAWAEQLWIVQRFAGKVPELLDDAVQSDDTVASAVATYRRTWQIVDDVVAAASLDTLCRDVGSSTPVNLRWVLMHLLEETARHAGHADILRELVDGTTGR
jgi:hypothetical protein